MPNPTTSMATALDRLASCIGAEVQQAGHGQRRIVFDRPNGAGPAEIEGTIGRCVYAAAMAATAPEEHGGLGMAMEELSEAVNLAMVPNRNLAGHEESLLRALTGRERAKRGGR